MRTDSLSFRLVMGATVSVILGLVAATILLNALFRNYVQDAMDSRLQVLLDSLISVAEVTEAGVPLPAGEVGDPRFRQPLGEWYWQITPTREGQATRSRSLWDIVLDIPLDVPAEDVRLHYLDGPAGQRLRAASRRIVLPAGDQPYVFTVAADTAQITAFTRPFTWMFVASLTVLGTVLVAAVFVQVRFGLRPLRRIPRAIAAIRNGRTERLTGSFPAEVEPLAVEINALIDHNREVVERARTQVGNLAHALKTPLTVLANDAARAEGPLGETARRQTEIMRRHVDHYLSRARMAARAAALGARTEVVPVVEDLRRTLARMHPDRELRVEVAGPAPAFRGEREDLEEMVGNLLENACKWAASTVRIAVRRRDGRLGIVVEDDGPGLEPDAREAAVARGRRLDESKPGSGLGLAIVADLSGHYGGGLELGESSLGGLRAALDLPAAETA